MKKILHFFDVLLGPVAEETLKTFGTLFKVGFTLAFGLIYMASIYYSIMAVVLAYMIWKGQATWEEYWGYILFGIAVFIARIWSKRILGIK